MHRAPTALRLLLLPSLAGAFFAPIGVVSSATRSSSPGGVSKVRDSSWKLLPASERPFRGREGGRWRRGGSRSCRDQVSIYRSWCWVEVGTCLVDTSRIFGDTCIHRRLMSSFGTRCESVRRCFLQTHECCYQEGRSPVAASVMELLIRKRFLPVHINVCSITCRLPFNAAAVNPRGACRDQAIERPVTYQGLYHFGADAAS